MPRFLTRPVTWKVDHSSHDRNSNYYSDNYPDDKISIISRGSSNSKIPLVDETPEDLKLRKRSHWVMYTTVCVMTIGFSVALSGVWPYLQLLDPSLSKSSLGWAIAANPLGQLIASPITGYLGNKLGSVRVIFYVTLTFFIAGNLMYSLLPMMTDFWYHSAFHMMIIARFIVGISSSNITLCRSYMASSTTINERTVSMAILSAAQSLGFIIGPALQTILVLTVQGDMLKYRSCGWLAGAFGLLNIFLISPPVFREFNLVAKEENERKKIEPIPDLPRITGTENEPKPDDLTSVTENEPKPDDLTSVTENEPKPDDLTSTTVTNVTENFKSKPDMPSVIGILISYFFSMLIFIFMETLSVPMLTDQYAWKDGVAVVVVGVMTLISGAMAIAIVLVIRKAVKKHDERKLLLFLGYIPIALGTFLYMPIYTNQTIPMSNCTNGLTSEDASGIWPDRSIDVNQLLSLKSPMTATNYNESYTSQECSLGCPQSQEWCLSVSRLPYTQFALANFFLISGLPVATALSMSLYSKAIGQRPQGLWMALLSVILSISRVIGPISASYIYTSFGTVVSFGILTVGMIIGLISYVAIHKRLPYTLSS